MSDCCSLDLNPSIELANERGLNPGGVAVRREWNHSFVAIGEQLPVRDFCEEVIPMEMCDSPDSVR